MPLTYSKAIKYEVLVAPDGADNREYLCENWENVRNIFFFAVEGGLYSTVLCFFRLTCTGFGEYLCTSGCLVDCQGREEKSSEVEKIKSLMKREGERDISLL